MTRRTFLAALVSAPFARKLAPVDPRPTYTWHPGGVITGPRYTARSYSRRMTVSPDALPR